MHQTAQTTEPTQNPDPQQDRPALPCIAFLLNVVRALLGYGRQLDENLPAQAEHKRFPVLAVGFGTHDVRRILAHVQRGILRAMMLERYLLARAAQGRDIEPEQPPSPAEPAEIGALELKLRTPTQAGVTTQRRSDADPDDPMHFVMPTMKELEAQVRRRSVGRTIAEICMDLGVIPAFCDGPFWTELYEALLHFGANLEQFGSVQADRREAFQLERDKRPETWDCDWRDRPKEAIRQLLGSLLGERPPGLLPASA